MIEDIKRADEGLQAALILVRDNVGGGRVALFTVSMLNALDLSALGAIRLGMGKCRVKLIESNNIR